MGVVAAAGPRQGDVFLVDLDPTRGREIRKTRPCLVVSPDGLHAHGRPVIIAPLTGSTTVWGFRVPCRFQGKVGSVALDQLRTADQQRLIRPLGRLSPAVQRRVLEVLQEMFAP